MAQIIYGLIRDCGDGSACMDWFKTEDARDLALEDIEYSMNEGSAAQTLTFPDTIDLEDAGFSFNDDYDNDIK
jgi:hypothetical protein